MATDRLCATVRCGGRGRQPRPFGMDESDAHGAGMAAEGIGCIHGREALIVANDPTIKGGAYPVTIKKRLRAP